MQRGKSVARKSLNEFEATRARIDWTNERRIPHFEVAHDSSQGAMRSRSFGTSQSRSLEPYEHLAALFSALFLSAIGKRSLPLSLPLFN